MIVRGGRVPSGKARAVTSLWGRARTRGVVFVRERFDRRPHRFARGRGFPTGPDVFMIAALADRSGVPHVAVGPDRSLAADAAKTLFSRHGHGPPLLGLMVTRKWP